MVALDVLQFISVFCMGIATGTNIAWISALVPVLRRLGAREALQTKQLLDVGIDRYQPRSVAVALAAGIASLFWDQSTAQYVCTAIGVGGAVGVTVTSLRFNVPINKLMRTWSVDAVPAEFRDELDRWSRYHAVRTVFTIVSLTGFLLAVLVD